MSQWAELFAALSRGAEGVDNGDNGPKNTPATPKTGSSVTVVTVVTVVTGGNGGRELKRSPEPAPVRLRDGRRLHRFRAGHIPPAAPARACNLRDRTHAYGVVLIADGVELIVVEPWLSSLPPDVLQQLKDAAGEVIAALRGEADARFARLPKFPP